MEHRPYPKIPARHDDASPSGVWIATEKIHGAHLVIATDGRLVRIGKRKAWLAANDTFFGWQLLRADLESAAKRIHEQTGGSEPRIVRLYGELFGGHYPHPDVPLLPGAAPVQTGIWYSPDIRFAFFDITIERREKNAGTFLAHDEVVAIAAANDLLSVPILGRGPRSQLERLPVRFPSHVARTLGLPPIADNVAEGFVLKPNVRAAAESRYVIKHKIPDFDDARFDDSSPWDPNALLDLKSLQTIAARMVNGARAASARSKVGTEPASIREEIVLDVLVDLEAAFPTAFRALDATGENLLREHVTTLAESLT